MKTNGKHTINRKPLSSEEINRMQNFDAVLKGAGGAGPKGGNGSGVPGNWWYLAGGALLITAALATWMFIPSDTEEAISRQVEQNIPETMPRTQEASEDLVRAPLVRLPVKEWDMAYTSYFLNAEKGGTIHHPGGTLIQVPGSCLIDGKGNPVKGQVEFRYREFFDPIDIALSGIPMHYDSAGISYYFETAGMSELLAFQNEKEVHIASGKKIEMKLNSPMPGNYNLYQLDQEKGWRAKGSTSAQEQKKPVLETLIVQSPIERKTNGISTNPHQLAAENLTREIEKLESVKPKAPQKSNINRPHFNLELDLKDFPELSGFDNMQFEVAPEDKVFTPEHFKVEWNDVKLKRYSDRRYKMILSRLATRQNPAQQIELIVIPVIEEQSYDAAKKHYDALMLDYEQRLNSKKQEEARLKKEASELLKKQEEILLAEQTRAKRAMESRVNFTRSFSIDGFGIWNCDNPRIKPDRIETCRFVDQSGEALVILAANCMLSKSKGLIILHEYNGRYNVPVNEGENEILLLLLEGNKIAFKRAVDLNPVNGMLVLEPINRTFPNAEAVKKYIYQFY